MSSVANAVGSLFGFGKKQKMPRYSGPSPEEAAQKARDEAAKKAEEIARQNAVQTAAMQTKLEQVRNQKTDYSGGTLGDRKTGLSRGANIAKLKRRKDARTTQVKLDKPDQGQIPGSQGQVQV